MWQWLIFSLLCDLTCKTRQRLYFVGPIWGSLIQDFKVFIRGTFASPSSLRGAIQFNGIVLSRGTQFILHAVVLHETLFQPTEVIHEIVLFMLEEVPPLTCIALLSRGGYVFLMSVSRTRDVDASWSKPYQLCSSRWT